MKKENGEISLPIQLEQQMLIDEYADTIGNNLTDADKAYALILDKIIKADMEPGSLIQERVLMDSLSLGRTPIREALRAVG